MPTWVITAGSFIKDNWKIVTFVVAVVATLMYIKSLQLDVAHRDTQIAQLTADNHTLKQNEEVLRSAINSQNVAIAKIDDLAAMTRKNFAKLGVDVATQRTTLSSVLSGILAEKKPSTCEETIQYLIAAQKGYTK